MMIFRKKPISRKRRSYARIACAQRKAPHRRKRRKISGRIPAGVDFGFETSRFLEFVGKFVLDQAICFESWNEPRFERQIPAFFGCRPIPFRREAAGFSRRHPFSRACGAAAFRHGSFNLRATRDSNFVAQAL